MARKRATARQHNQLGVTFFQSGAVDLAVEQFTRAIKSAPGVGTYWLNLGVALLDRGDLDRATTALEKSSHLNPKSQSTYFHLAQIHTKRGEALAAREAYLKVIELDSQTYFAQRARELTEGRIPKVIVRGTER